ncbi:MAG: response regulator, partial [candidate division WOR-3 bacterium]
MKYRVLVVDDDKFVRQWLAGMLAEQDVEAREASNGEEALATTEKNDLDLVLLDFDLGPGIDGLEVLRQVREKRPDLPVVMISGVARGGQGAEAMKLGAYDYVLKPFDVGVDAKACRVLLHAQVHHAR